MIKEISFEEAYNLVKCNKEQVTIKPKGTFYGYYEGDVLTGVISTNETKNTIRIKTFYVIPEARARSIGTQLLNHVVIDNNPKEYTVFATKRAYRLFLDKGFETVSQNKYGITFMRRRSV